MLDHSFLNSEVTHALFHCLIVICRREVEKYTPKNEIKLVLMTLVIRIIFQKPAIDDLILYHIQIAHANSKIHPVIK